MGNDAERAEEIKRDKDYATAGRMLNGGLASLLEASGTSLRGLSFKMDPYETLAIIKGVQDGNKVVCFVGARDAGACLMKARNMIRDNKLSWRADKWAG